MSLAQGVQDSALLVQAHCSLGLALYYLGNFVGAREHLEQVSMLYDLRQHRALAFQYGQDPSVASNNFAASNLWLLGYPAHALAKSQDALAVAGELRHALSSAFALLWAAVLHAHRGEWAAMQARAEEVIALATEHGLPFWLTLGIFWRGWALAEQGQGEEGIALMRQGLATHQATGAQLGLSWTAYVLAEACGTVGQVELSGVGVLSSQTHLMISSQCVIWISLRPRLRDKAALRETTLIEQAPRGW